MILTSPPIFFSLNAYIFIYLNKWLNINQCFFTYRMTKLFFLLLYHQLFQNLKNVIRIRLKGNNICNRKKSSCLGRNERNGKITSQHLISSWICYWGLITLYRVSCKPWCCQLLVYKDVLLLCLLLGTLFTIFLMFISSVFCLFKETAESLKEWVRDFAVPYSFGAS